MAIFKHADEQQTKTAKLQGLLLLAMEVKRLPKHQTYPLKSKKSANR